MMFWFEVFTPTFGFKVSDRCKRNGGCCRESSLHQSLTLHKQVILKMNETNSPFPRFHLRRRQFRQKSRVLEQKDTAGGVFQKNRWSDYIFSKIGWFRRFRLHQKHGNWFEQPRFNDDDDDDFSDSPTLLIWQYCPPHLHWVHDHRPPLQYINEHIILCHRFHFASLQA